MDGRAMKAALSSPTPSSAACTAIDSYGMPSAVHQRSARMSSIEEVRPRVQVHRPVIAGQPFPVLPSKTPLLPAYASARRVKHRSFGEGWC